MSQMMLLEVEAPRGQLTADTDELYTPRWIRNLVGPVDLDPCAEPEKRVRATRHLVGRHGADGLAAEWGPVVHGPVHHPLSVRPAKVYCNPPYNKGRDGKSAVGAWVAKAAEEWEAGHAETVMLIPAGTSNSYWWTHIFGKASYLGFIRGRQRFENAAGLPTEDGGTFSSVLVVWGRSSAAVAWVRVMQRSSADVRWVPLDKEGVIR